MKKVCILVVLLVSLVSMSYGQQLIKEKQYQFILPEKLASSVILLLQGNDDRVSVKDSKEILNIFMDWYTIQFNYYDSISKIKHIPKDSLPNRDTISNIKKPKK